MNYNLMPGEEIKPIQDYPNYYITSFGRVWSCLQGGHWLQPTLNCRGSHKRYYINLGRKHRFFIHQLVAHAFLPNPNNYTEIDHIDGDGLNNNINNLQWCTHQTNMSNINTQEKITKNGGNLYEIEEIATGNLFWGYKAVMQYSGLSEQTIRNHIYNKVKKPQWRFTGKRKSYTNKKILDV